MGSRLYIYIHIYLILPYFVYKMVCGIAHSAAYTLDSIIKRKYNVITEKLIKKQEYENGNNSKKVFRK